MKKIIVSIVVIVLMVALGVGGYMILNKDEVKDNGTSQAKEEKEVTIYVKHYIWNYWGTEDDITRQKKEYDALQPEEYKVKEEDSIKIEGIADLKIKIISITDEEIEIKTNQKLYNSDNNEDTNSTKRFIIKKGESMKLDLADIYDAGETFEIEYR